MNMKTQGIIGQIARIQEKANSLILQELHKHGITGVVPAHGTVLVCLFQQQEPVPIKFVVERVRRVKSTVTGIINTLEAHGYIRKFKSTEDQRVVYVTLTEKGRRIKNNFESISDILLNKVYGSMPQKDREALVQYLSVLEENLSSKK